MNFVHTGKPEDIIPKIGKMRYICCPKLRRRRMGSGTPKGRKAIHRATRADVW